MRYAVCTLCEGDYHHGVATLINSLIRAGYNGDFWLGYKGALPVWIRRRIVKDPVFGELVKLNSRSTLRLCCLETNWHISNYKPIFIEKLFNGKLSNAETVYFFDPDITVRASWGFFVEWTKYGLALCEDVNSPLHRSHPRRLGWQKGFPKLNFRDDIGDSYINAGFIGIAKEYRDVLSTWTYVIEDAERFTGGPDKWLETNRASPESLFSTFEQDALNIALSCTKFPLSVVGPEGMGFRPGGYIMDHAIGARKPWQGSYTQRALRGFGPAMRRVNLCET